MHATSQGPWTTLVLEVPQANLKGMTTHHDDPLVKLKVSNAIV